MSRPPRRDANGAAWRRARRRVLASQDICALCGRPVDKSLPYLHPLSAQVDHIIPFSKGGDVLSPANLQLAHRACNRQKGNGDQPQALTTSRPW